MNTKISKDLKKRQLHNAPNEELNSNKDRQHAKNNKQLKFHQFNRNEETDSENLLYEHNDEHNDNHNNSQLRAIKKRNRDHELFNPCPNWISYSFFIFAGILFHLMIRYGNAPNPIQKLSHLLGFQSELDESELYHCNYTSIPIDKGSGNLCVFSNIFEWNSNDQINSLNIDSKNLNYEQYTLLVLQDLLSNDPLSLTVNKFKNFINYDLFSIIENESKKLNNKKMQQSQEILNNNSNNNNNNRKLSFEFITFDWRGNGMSTGHSAHLRPLHNDLKQIWNYFQLENKKIIVIAQGISAQVFYKFLEKFHLQTLGTIYLNPPLILGDDLMNSSNLLTWIPNSLLKKNWFIQSLSSLLPLIPIKSIPTEWIHEEEMEDNTNNRKLELKTFNIWRECMNKNKNLFKVSNKSLILFSKENKIVNSEKSSVVARSYFSDEKSEITIEMIENYPFHNLIKHKLTRSKIVSWIINLISI